MRNAYFIDVNEIVKVFNIFDKMNIVQFKIENMIFHKEIFVEREILRINIIHYSSRKRVICFNCEDNHDFYNDVSYY